MRLEKQQLLMTAAAVVVALGVGFTVARLTDGAGSAKSEAEAEHGHEEGEAKGAETEGFVALTPEQAAAAGIEIVRIGRGGGAEVLLPGRVAFAPNAQAGLGAPLAGTVVQVHAAAGTSVGAGAPIATLRSAEGAATRASLDAARAAAEAARSAEVRERRLLDEGVVSRQDWEAARAGHLKAQADLRAAQAQTAAVGSPGASGVVVVRSPIAGIVTRVMASPGVVLTQGSEVAEVADPGRVELVFDAPPAVAGLITTGAPMEARRPDGQLITGVVTAVAPAAAGGGATVRVRPSGPTPPPGTVVSARLSGKATGALVVPTDAVQTVEGVPSVFVVEGSGFRAQPVVTGRTAGGWTEVVRGLSGSERIAGKSAFLLKAELAKGEAEHGH